MNILLNDQLKNLDEPATLADLAEQHTDPEQAYALALNDQFIPRSNYATIELKEGDRVELLIPMQGG